MSPSPIPIPNSRSPFLWLLCALTCLLPGNVQAAPLTAHALRLPQVAGTEAIFRDLAVSPDGRWLAYVLASERQLYHGSVRLNPNVAPKPGRIALVLYDLISARAQTVDLGPLDPRADGFSLLAWRPDSRACAVGTEIGWAIVTPGRERARWIDRTHGVWVLDCRPAWSPRGGRLAFFSEDGDFWVWDGTRIRHKANWLKQTGIPSYADERPWQCEWSPDGRFILFRFYGDSVRDSTDTGHLAIVDASMGRLGWGTEAGPAHWLDNTRIAFRAGNAATDVAPDTLQVATARREHSWRADVAAWALTDRWDAVWIVTGEGDVWRTPLPNLHWRRVGRSGTARNRTGTFGVSVSPDGSQAALTTGSAVELFRQGGPVRQWRHPGFDITVLGWVAGRNLPLLAVEPEKSGPTQVWQMEQK